MTLSQSLREHYANVNRVEKGNVYIYNTENFSPKIDLSEDFSSKVGERLGGSIERRKTSCNAATTSARSLAVDSLSAVL